MTEAARPGRLAPVAAVVIMLVAACGGDSDVASPTSPPTSADGTTVASTAGSGTAVATTAPATTAVVSTSVSTPPASSAPVPSTGWTPVASNLVGLPSECGNMTSVFVRPDRDVVIAGIALRGLWASVDGSDTWTNLGLGAGSDQITNRPTSLVFDPEQPDRYWESGIYDGGGVYRTDDDGATFEQLGDAAHSDLVSVDLTDPERRTMLTGTHERPDVFRSSDGGATWRNVSATLPAGIGFATAPHVIDAQTHLLGTNEGPDAGVFRTTDGAATWTPVHSGGIAGAPLVADGVITWLQHRGGGLLRSTDGGATWTDVPSGGEIYTYAEDLIRLADGRLATLGGSNVIVSDDDGASWTPVGPPLPYAPTGLAYSPVREAFYVWRFDCDFSTDNPIPPDAIMRWDVAAG